MLRDRSSHHPGGLAVFVFDDDFATTVDAVQERRQRNGERPGDADEVAPQELVVGPVSDQLNVLRAVRKSTEYGDRQNDW